MEPNCTFGTFGERVCLTSTEFENRYAFTGREWDGDLDLYYYRARYYDPAEGRFIGADPLAFAAGDVNLYRYVGNSPALLTDPSGLDATKIPRQVSLLRKASHNYELGLLLQMEAIEDAKNDVPLKDCNNKLNKGLELQKQATHEIHDATYEIVTNIPDTSSLIDFVVGEISSYVVDAILNFKKDTK